MLFSQILQNNFTEKSFLVPNRITVPFSRGLRESRGMDGVIGEFK